MKIKNRNNFDAKILIVDDDNDVVQFLSVMLAGTGYTNVEGTTEPKTVKALYQQCRYDLILLDIKMPELDGFQVMEQLSALDIDDYLPILILTARQDMETRLKALECGAMDFITKPFEAAEVLNRIANILDVRKLYKERIFAAGRLERKVEERTRQLAKANEALIVTVQERTQMLSQEITERRETEKTLFVTLDRAEAAEQYLLHAIESISEGFAVFDKHDRLVLWNKHYEEIWTDLEGFIKKGVSFQELVDAYVATGIVDHTVGGREAWRKHRLEFYYDCQELEINLRDGRILLSRDHMMPDGGRVGIRTDITKLKQNEKSLIESEARFRAIAETSPVAIVITRRDDSAVLYSNAQADELLGAPYQDLIGRKALDFYTNPLDRSKIREILKDNGRVRNREIMIRSLDGIIKWIIVSMEMINFEGHPALLSASVDITEMHDARNKLIQAAKMATLGEMASGIAHEINQPLGIIKMAAETAILGLNSGKYGSEQIENKLSTVIDQSDRMAEIINHMRLFSRKDNAESIRFNPANTVDSIVNLMTGQFEVSGINLDKQIPPTCPDIFGSPVQLEQVLLNLLSNARDSVLDKLKQSQSRSGDFHPKVTVKLRTNPQQDQVIIYVVDNGVGIAKELRDNIFEPFYTTKPSGTGTGLGLSISCNIIVNMGGDILCREKGGNTLFRISIPMVPVDENEIPEAKPKDLDKVSDTMDLGREKINHVLVVDDEQLAAEGISDYLMQFGYQVTIAGDGAVAMDILASQSVNMLITDLRMPVMDGNELITKVREKNKNLPIIVTTGHTVMGDDEEVLADGATLVLRKPIRLRDIKDFIGVMNP